MKRFNLLILLCLICVGPALAQFEYSREMVRSGGTDERPTLRVRVMANDKKELQEKAILSVLDAYIFYGIEGVGTGKELINEHDRDKHYEFFRRVYKNKMKYGLYAVDVKETQKAHRNDVGLQEAVYTLTLNKAAWDKALENEGIIKKNVKVEIAPEILPSIMVIPYRKNGETFREVLDRAPHIRVAISTIQNLFDEHGYETVDFIGLLESRERDGQFAQDNADSFATQLIRAGGTDIYVTVDGTRIMMGRGEERVDLFLKAMYTANGKVLANKEASARSSHGISSLCKAAIHRCGDEFMKTINEKFRSMTGQGDGANAGTQNAKLVVTVDGNSTIDLDTEMGDDMFTIGDYIRQYIKKNARGAKMAGATPLLMQYDTLLIPTVNKKGETVEVTDFANALTKFLRSKGVGCTRIIDGLTMRITISD